MPLEECRNISSTIAMGDAGGQHQRRGAGASSSPGGYLLRRLRRHVWADQ
jgi:hypothetical protein